MIKQHKEHGRNLGTGKVMALDSYDGAEHMNTEKSRTNPLSFSSILLSCRTVSDGWSAGKSLNILTWQQMNCEEKVEFIYPQ